MIVMESLRQNLKGEALQQRSLLLCQPLKRLLYTLHQPLCVRGVDNKEILPRHISVLSMMQLTWGQRDGGPCFPQETMTKSWDSTGLILA